MSYVQSNILGALGTSQLKKIDWMNNERKLIADYYIRKLSDIPNLNFLRITDGSVNNWHLFGILVPEDFRYWIMDALRAEGVYANVHYTPLHRNKFYKSYAIDEDMEGSLNFYNRLLRLPIYPGLTKKERELVVNSVKKIFDI